jgi:Uma2 family endonuclease
MMTSAEQIEQHQSSLIIGEEREPQMRLITVKEYDKMVKRGVYGTSDHIELLNGVIMDKYKGKRHLITVKEYERMIKAGIYDENDRIELLNGAIINMSPKKTPHPTATNRSAKHFDALLGNKILVRNQDPIVLHDLSEPEPDIVLVVPDDMEYADRTPTPTDIYLVMEVSDTTLRYDRKVKGAAYAKAGITQYVILNLKRRELEDYREPSEDGYRSKQTYSAEQSFSLVAFPEISVKVSDLLPPERKDAA